MGLFSRDCLEQYRREIQITRRVLAAGALLATGFHAVSLPLVDRLTAGLIGDFEPNFEATPIDVFVEDELIQETPEPEPEPADVSPEPVAAAQRPSAPPLATVAEPIPVSEVAAADTVVVEATIAAENGSISGQGAVGISDVVGLVPGLSLPTEAGNEISLPSLESEPVFQPQESSREAVVSIADRPRPTSRRVSCSPCSAPAFPASAQRRENQGQPVIRATFDGQGRIIDAVIEVPSGNPAFDRAALAEARSNWRFQDPVGVGGQVSVAVTYVIEGTDDYSQAQREGEVLSIELPIQQRQAQGRSSQAQQSDAVPDASADGVPIPSTIEAASRPVLSPDQVESSIAGAGDGNNADSEDGPEETSESDSPEGDDSNRSGTRNSADEALSVTIMPQTATPQTAMPQTAANSVPADTQVDSSPRPTQPAAAAPPRTVASPPSPVTSPVEATSQPQPAPPMVTPRSVSPSPIPAARPRPTSKPAPAVARPVAPRPAPPSSAPSRPAPPRPAPPSLVQTTPAPTAEATGD